MIKEKRGAELSINVIIIAILVILVLIMVAAFFTGGSTKLFSAVRDIFGITTAGTDRSLAEQSCQQYCVTAQNLQNYRTSPYCTKSFNIDTDGNSEAEYTLEGNLKIYKKYYCTPNPIEGESLNIPCIDKQGQQVLC